LKVSTVLEFINAADKLVHSYLLMRYLRQLPSTCVYLNEVRCKLKNTFSLLKPVISFITGFNGENEVRYKLKNTILTSFSPLKPVMNDISLELHPVISLDVIFFT